MDEVVNDGGLGLEIRSSYEDRNTTFTLHTNISSLQSPVTILQKGTPHGMRHYHACFNGDECTDLMTHDVCS